MMKVKIEKFDGPLNLLLQLIEKEKLDITEVSLSQVASQFIDYIKNTEKIDPDEVADFLVIASKLLLIKSKALLPYLYPEEEQETEDFEKQLKMYKQYLEVAKIVAKMLDKRKFMFAREFNRKVVLVNREKSFSPPSSIAARDLGNSMDELLARIRPVEKMEETKIADNINIEDKIYSIQQLIAKRIKFSFGSIMKEASSKTEVIVSFLAMLEMMRQREVVLVQDNLFSEIIIHKK
jgi:segregation and condensation protein A